MTVIGDSLTAKLGPIYNKASSTVVSSSSQKFSEEHL